MDTQQLLTAIDDEIDKLTYVRSLLTGFDDKPSAPKHHTMSAEGRQHIADGQRKRWAKVRKAKRRQPNKPPTGG